MDQAPRVRPAFFERLRTAGQRPFVRLLVEVGVLLLIVSAVGAFQGRGLLQGGTEPSVKALPSLDGATVTLASLRGRPVLLAFWAPWCGLCGAEAQNLAWVRKLAGDSAHVVTVAASGGEAEVRDFVRAHGVEGPVLLADDEVVRRFAVDVFPTVYFLDPQGRIKRSVVGYTTTAGLLLRLFL
jgi:thiol-disulfide isomerase/thioredoxin